MIKQVGKILLTGVSGLVGTRLLPRLMEKGWECQCVVRAGKEVPAGAIAVEGDLFDMESLKRAVKDVSAVIHLAAVFRTQDTDLIWKSNFEGARNLIAATIDQAPKARFIMASTAHVYNANNPHPGREDDVVEPEHAYPASKVAAEKELRNSALNWSILRFPFVYGDGDGHLEMLPKYAPAAKWHPAMKMSTIHHRDIATGMEMALAGIMDGHIVNITDEATTSIYELVKLVGGNLPSSSEPLQNPWHLHADASFARSLGFQASVRTVYQAMQEKLL